MKRIREFPDWETRYREVPVEEMPWFFPDLDPDFNKALEKTGLSGGKVLDLGTGPGTQAVALAKRGFTVSAYDVSPSAIEAARKRAVQENVVLDTRVFDLLKDQTPECFDAVFDRGCFHVFDPDPRAAAVRKHYELLKPGGFLFLKTFSIDETREEGPYRFSEEEIEELFVPGGFEILDTWKSEFPGRLDLPPKALFTILRRRTTAPKPA
ncbi:MAG: class I SAM-dependent methyltransferase [Candidatus Hydrogenedentota bacterium]|nr:MAG: class I SAM-dependent methyltransferase [Candidatus Hydrogenedentota bacterium]